MTFYRQPFDDPERFISSKMRMSIFVTDYYAIFLMLVLRI